MESSLNLNKMTETAHGLRGYGTYLYFQQALHRHQDYDTPFKPPELPSNLVRWSYILVDSLWGHSPIPQPHNEMTATY